MVFRAFSLFLLACPALCASCDGGRLPSFAGAGDVPPPPPLREDAGVASGCVKQSAPSASSGCDPTKEDLYTCQGGDTPGGTCHPSAQAGSFCCEVGSNPTAVQKGTLIDLTTKAPVTGATLTLGAATATTDASGKYSATVDTTKPFNMKVQKDGYLTLTEQETQVKTDIDLGKTSFLSESTATLLLATLTGYDDTLGVLSVAVENQGCADEGGATLELTSGGQPLPNAKLYYFSGGVPSPTQPSAVNGEFPHAVAYNVPVGQPITVTVKHPTCTMIAFPVEKKLDTGSVTYTSATIATSPGKATSFVRVFLK